MYECGRKYSCMLQTNSYSGTDGYEAIVCHTPSTKHIAMHTVHDMLQYIFGR